MATEATPQIPETAVETAGISVVSSTRTLDLPRQGSIYNPTSFAAGVPVWFHRRNDGKYLGLFSEHWAAATGVYNDGPQLFSDYTESLTPVYMVIDPATGAAAGPYFLSGLDTMNAAVSRGDYLFVLGTRDSKAWLQHYVITRSNALQLQGEELVPNDFHLGLYADNFHLWVFGPDEDGFLTRIRKNWGRIGSNADPALQWEYEGERGWFSDPEESRAMTGDLPANGPCSVAKFRDRYFIMTTSAFEGDVWAQPYSARAVDTKWKPFDDPIMLGTDDTALGAAYLQPQLTVNPSLVSGDTGFAYVTSVLVEDDDNAGILTQWSILSV